MEIEMKPITLAEKTSSSSSSSSPSITKEQILNNKLEEVKSVMNHNINQTLENIDLGNDLEQKSEIMRGISKEFSIRSKKVKRRIWYRNARVNICLLFLVSGLFYYIYNSIN